MTNNASTSDCLISTGIPLIDFLGLPEVETRLLKHGGRREGAGRKPDGSVKRLYHLQPHHLVRLEQYRQRHQLASASEALGITAKDVAVMTEKQIVDWRERALNAEAEVEGLEGMVAGDDIAIGELRAEVERLKADYNAAYTNYVTQRDEAERLREALEQIMLNAPLNSPERITASRALGRAKE